MSKIAIAIAAVAVLGSSTVFAQQGQWNVLMEKGTGACFASNAAPGAGEEKIGGPYQTERGAQAMIAKLAACQTYVETIGKT